MRKLFFTFFLRLFRLGRSAIPSSKKGLIIILIDGLGYEILKQQIQKNRCPFLKSLIKNHDYRLMPYCCGIPAVTPATEAELFFGNSTNIPSFTWYDRTLHHFVRGNNSEEIEIFENSLTAKEQFLLNGSCILGVYNAGASQCSFSSKDSNVKKPLRILRSFHFLFAILLNPLRLGLTVYLVIKSVLVSGYISVFRKSRKKFIPLVLESFSHSLLGNVASYVAELELLRETPILFIDYVLYDEFAHTYSIKSKTAKGTLRLIDWYCKSLVESSKKSDRKYDVIIMSDHGQTDSIVFEHRFKQSLSKFFLLALQDQTRTIIKTQGKVSNSQIDVGKDVFLVPSGSMMHVYFSERFTNPYLLNEIATKYPRLIDNLLKHPGVGWILVRETADTQLLISTSGSVQYKNGVVVKISGQPFKGYNISSEALDSLAPFAKFNNIGDLVVFGNVKDGKVFAFEEQRSTHGGFYGPMTEPFILTNNPELLQALSKKASMKELFSIIRQAYKSHL